ncbi:hypothetical protein HAP94_06565 [Acidithiobacillus ferrivorans]|nr:hypothetical protein [Acidithiobacillus ferrivorans]
MDTKTTDPDTATAAPSKLQLAEQWWATFTPPQKSQICRCMVGNLPRTMQASPNRHKKFLRRLVRNGMDPVTLVKAKPKAAALISQHLPALIADDHHNIPDDTFISEVLSSVCESDTDLGKAYISVMLSAVYSNGKRKQVVDPQAPIDAPILADEDKHSHPDTDDPLYWGRRTVENLFAKQDIFFNISEKFLRDAPPHIQNLKFHRISHFADRQTSSHHTHQHLGE